MISDVGDNHLLEQIKDIIITNNAGRTGLGWMSGQF
jgi:hypothetical protein